MTEVITLFEPKEGKEMKSEYPELAEVSEFAILRDAQLRFVWYISSSSSDIINVNKEDRIKMALKRSKYELSLRDKELNDIVNGRFPTEIQAAIKKMEVYQPSLRSRAKDLSVKMLNNLEKMINIPEDKIGEMEISERDRYASLCKNTIIAIDELIPRIEQSGVAKKIRKEERSGPNQMDRVIAEG